MLQVVYELYESGRIKERHVAAVDENGNILDEDKQDYISIPAPNNIYHPKWDGLMWIEDETEDEKLERESNMLLALLEPTPEEIQDAQFEIKIITLLTYLELI